jgi:hypothetical protein
MPRTGLYISGAAIVMSTLLPCSAVAQVYDDYSEIPSDTVLTVRTNEEINASTGDGQIFTGVVDQDVTDTNGRVAIPRGSTVELMARTAGNTSNSLVLDLESVTIAGRRFALDGSAEHAQSLGGLGANQKTAEYVGGGALLGTIIGAVVGGGKGAAIGAATGAAAGAGAQILTSGARLRVPRGSLLTFRLASPLDVGIADTGFSRSGRHYHRYGRE